MNSYDQVHAHTHMAASVVSAALCIAAYHKIRLMIDTSWFRAVKMCVGVGREDLRIYVIW